MGKTDYWFRLSGQLIHKFVDYFLMEASPESILKPQEAEIKDAQWFSPREALKILGYKKDSLELFRKAFEELKIMV